MMNPDGWAWMLVWIGALLVMVWLIARPTAAATPEQDATAILRARYARGEIDDSEYDRALRVLRGEKMEMPR